MPELPDVAGFCRVAGHAAGHRVEDVRVHDASVLRDSTPRRITGVLRGRMLGAPRRHGKWLGLPVREKGRRHRADEPVLALHFGMTGSLLWCRSSEPRHRHDRVVVITDSGELRYRDMRKLQGVRLLPDDAGFAGIVDGLGPDAASTTRDELAERLAGSRATVKALLMDQSAVAGLGNLTVDETLWRARLAPTLPAREVDGAGVGRLHRSMRSVLRQSSKVGHVPARPSWLTGHRDERAGDCPRCGSRLRHERVGGRGTVWCPRCQRTGEEKA